MGQHPLIERAGDKLVRQAKGFQEAAVALTGDELLAEYEREVTAAPRRGEAGKKYLVAYNSRLAAEAKAGREGEHLCIALAHRHREGGAPLLMPEEDSHFEALHPLVPLRSAPVDKSKGADDPNFGFDKIDLVGRGPGDRLAAAATRWLPPDAGRVGTGDTPLRALLLALAHAAVAEANAAELTGELAACTEGPFAEARPAVMLIGSPRYWELCRKRSAQRGAAWIREMERLAKELTELGLPVHYLSVKMKEVPPWSYESGSPVLSCEPRLVDAWEASAGRVKPKAKPRARKTAASSENEIIEADLTRPIRAYGVAEHFDPGDRIQHPTLGLGVVQGSAGPQKIRVLFDEKRSTLVHDRPRPGATA
ncbi:MAG: hypothetical protein CL910_06990 [Deltaproteobacteria bacterium]|nr:hypothetical protein [Deltaproteobacteria bacterium]